MSSSRTNGMRYKPTSPASPRRIHSRNLQASSKTSMNTPNVGVNNSWHRIGLPFSESPTQASASIPSTRSVSGMDIISPKSLTEKRRRRERYDPCCPVSPTNLSSQLLSQSFDGGMLRSNRKRANSEKGPYPSPHYKRRLQGLDGEESHTPRKHNRQRAHSIGPLVGTTVFLEGRSTSHCSLDSADSTDRSISSLEEASLKETKKKVQIRMQPKFRPTTAWPADYPQAYPYKHQLPKRALSNMVIPELPSAESITASRRTASAPVSSTSFCEYPINFLKLNKRCSLHGASCRSGIDPEASSSRQFQSCRSSRNSPCIINKIQGRWASQTRFLKSLMLLCVVAVAISSLDVTTRNLQSIDLPPKSAVLVEKNLEGIRTVKNFSGEWGLTLTDSTKELQRGEKNGVRKRRRPKLAEANSFATQHLSHTDTMGSKNFVLTDDEIKKKTYTSTSNSIKKYGHFDSLKDKAFSCVLMFMLVSALVVAVATVWKDISRRSRLMKLQLRKSKNFSLYQSQEHSHLR